VINLKYIINYGKGLIIPLGTLFISPIILAILNLVGMKSYNIIILIIMIIASFIGGIKIGRMATKKGYINGLIFGFILIGILFLFSLFSKESRDISTVMYYLIILITSTVGSMIGVQKKITE